jgi:hypothetical protein
MATKATVWFSDHAEMVTGTAEVEDYQFREGGWVSVKAKDGWVHYPSRSIARIVVNND